MSTPPAAKIDVSHRQERVELAARRPKPERTISTGWSGSGTGSQWNTTAIHVCTGQAGDNKPSVFAVPAKGQVLSGRIQPLLSSPNLACPIVVANQGQPSTPGVRSASAIESPTWMDP
ncbi:hypothetical protein VDGL01_06600 [Verticillium dahliae]